MKKIRRLRRIKKHAWFRGVCAGFAYWVGAPAWLVRLIWSALFLWYGTGLAAYILLWIFMPEWEEDPPDYVEVSG